jgi:hypothetical protein
MTTHNDDTLIDLYLKGKLAGEALVDFQQRMKNDPDFASEVSLQSDILKGIRAAGRKELKAQLASITMQPGEVVRTKRLPRTLIVAIAASVLVVVGFSWWFFIYQNPGNKAVLAVEINRQSTPVTSVVIPSKTFVLDNSQGKQITLPSGENISIPSGAMVDEKGNSIKGKIKVAMKDLNNPFDQFLSGIPTAFDSAQQVRYLRPATMFQLSATASVNISFSPLKPVRVFFPADDTFPSNHIYKLDTLNKRWVACGEDKIIDLNKYTPARNVSNVFRPRLEDKTKQRFKISVKENQFPELSEYKNFIFEIAPQETNYDSIDDQQVWKNIVIQKGAPGEPYLVTFKNDAKTVTYRVIPVFAKEYYAQAMKIYNEKMKKLAPSSSQDDDSHPYELAQLIAKTIPGDERHHYYHIFAITSPGIYSNSRLAKLPDNNNHEVTFTDEQGHAISLTQLAIADFSTGVMQHLKVGARVKLPLGDPTGKAILGTISNHELAYLTPSEFGKINTGKNMTIVKLRIVDIGQKNYPILKEQFGQRGLAMILKFMRE